MSKILILYASATGNTELLAETMHTYLKELQHQVTIKNFDFDEITVDELKVYDATLIGVYTYDYGEIPYEVEFFYDWLDEIELTSSICGVFGAGDSLYGDTFGMAVDLMYEKLVDSGAQLYPEKLKVDLQPEDEDFDRCKNLVRGVLQLIRDKGIAVDSGK